MPADQRPPAANDLGRNTVRREADAVTKWLSVGVVAIAILLIARAVWQDVVIDEADTALAWVLPPYPQHWPTNPNNHLLNSLLAQPVRAPHARRPGQHQKNDGGKLQ